MKITRKLNCLEGKQQVRVGQQDFLYRSMERLLCLWYLIWQNFMWWQQFTAHVETWCETKSWETVILFVIMLIHMHTWVHTDTQSFTKIRSNSIYWQFNKLHWYFLLFIKSTSKWVIFHFCFQTMKKNSIITLNYSVQLNLIGVLLRGQADDEESFMSRHHLSLQETLVELLHKSKNHHCSDFVPACLTLITLSVSESFFIEEVFCCNFTHEQDWDVFLKNYIILNFFKDLFLSSTSGEGFFSPCRSCVIRSILHILNRWAEQRSWLRDSDRLLHPHLQCCSAAVTVQLTVWHPVIAETPQLQGGKTTSCCQQRLHPLQVPAWPRVASTNLNVFVFKGRSLLDISRNRSQLVDRHVDYIFISGAWTKSDHAPEITH